MTSPTGKRNKASGLTLIEILVAVVILVMGSILITPALTRAAWALERTQNQREVYLFASSKMAEVEVDMREGVLPRRKRGIFYKDTQAYKWRVKASPVSETSQLHTVELMVSWERGGDLYEHQYETLLMLLPEEEEEGL